MHTKTLLTAFATLGLLLGMTTVAWAGCDLKCPEDQQCCSEATNGGTYDCDALNSAASMH